MEEIEIKQERKEIIVNGLCAMLEDILDDMERDLEEKKEVDHWTIKYHHAQKIANYYLSKEQMERYQRRHEELTYRRLYRKK